MSNEHAFHEGYRKAIQDVAQLVDGLAGDPSKVDQLLAELKRRSEHARVKSRSSLASSATGDRGY